MLKQNGGTLRIKEQLINDPVTGLTLIFRLTPSGEPRLHLSGENLPFGNRDFQFDKNGELAGTGTGTGGSCIIEPIISDEVVCRHERFRFPNAGDKWRPTCIACGYELPEGDDGVMTPHPRPNRESEGDDER